MSLFNSRVDREKIKECLKKGNRKIHFIGILGAGMTPLAEFLGHLGHEITGSDREYKEGRGSLLYPIASTHDGKNVEGRDLAVYSLAISEDNPEYKRALELNIPTVSRAQLLGVIMEDYKHRIAVSGTHGKSTTVAMLHCIFSRWGADPTVLSGAELVGGGALRWGGKNYFIYESCEYRDSFLSFLPTVQIITNAEYDHADYFKSHGQMKKSFIRAANLTRDRVFLNADDPSSLEIACEIQRPLTTFGTAEGCDYYAEIMDDGTNSFAVYKGGEKITEISLSVLGKGNMYDALASVALCHSMGVPVGIIKEALEGFRGIGRRMELLGQVRGRAVYYDYAHHPTEIINTLTALKKNHAKITVIFLPHTYSRTGAFFREFQEALALADYSVVLPTYSARENYAPEFDSQSLASSIGDGCISLLPERVFEYTMKNTEGAVILMGAGDLSRVLSDFRAHLEQ